MNISALGTSSSFMLLSLKVGMKLFLSSTKLRLIFKLVLEKGRLFRNRGNKKQGNAGTAADSASVGAQLLCPINSLNQVAAWKIVRFKGQNQATETEQ